MCQCVGVITMALIHVHFVFYELFMSMAQFTSGSGKSERDGKLEKLSLYFCAKSFFFAKSAQSCLCYFSH